MREITERYGLPYNTGPLHRQFGSVVRKIARLSLPALPGRGRPPQIERRQAGTPALEPAEAALHPA